MKKITRSKNYSSLIKDLSSIIKQGRKTAVQSVNTVLVAAYWLIGKKIIEFEQKDKERAEYGEAALVRISNDLMGKYGKGFSLPQLKI